jgi:sorbitol/mannitol transport system permease protein
MTSTPTDTNTPPGAHAPRRRPPGAAAQAPPAKLRAWVTRAPLPPALVFLIIVTQLPMVATLVVSVFDWNALYP